MKRGLGWLQDGTYHGGWMGSAQMDRGSRGFLTPFGGFSPDVTSM